MHFFFSYSRMMRCSELVSAFQRSLGFHGVLSHDRMYPFSEKQYQVWRCGLPLCAGCMRNLYRIAPPRIWYYSTPCHEYTPKTFWEFDSLPLLGMFCKIKLLLWTQVFPLGGRVLANATTTPENFTFIKHIEVNKQVRIDKKICDQIFRVLWLDPQQ